MPNVSPLASPSLTRAVLEAHGLVAKKALGQNFLINDAIVAKILALAGVGAEDYILEVGPGIGTLTTALLRHAACVVAVERDVDLPAVLADTCALWADSFVLIGKDALTLTEADLQNAMARLVKKNTSDKVVYQRMPQKLVANLPYAVAATLILDYLERFNFLESLTVMVQKEVADRICASPKTKDYGAFTVKLSLFAQPVERFSVGASNFFPSPRVDSAVLRLDRCLLYDHEGMPVPAHVVQASALMADAAFATRRKTLANSCKTYFKRDGRHDAVAEALPLLFEQADIDPRRRGETLSRDEFLRLGAAYVERFAD